MGLSRSSCYYRPTDDDHTIIPLLHAIDTEYTRHPFIGTRRMVHYLAKQGYFVNRKRIQSYYRLLGIEAVYPKPKTTKYNPEHKIYPYLLRNLPITYCDQVWSSDITYIRLRQGFLYLMAIIDWYSRFVLNWRLSISLDADFCIEALGECLEHQQCTIFNTDQGVQFTCNEWVKRLEANGIKISMDGRGRALDNIFVERLWRSVKYECIYLNDFDRIKDVQSALEVYFYYYNHQRPHQSLDYKTPASIYLQN